MRTRTTGRLAFIRPAVCGLISAVMIVLNANAEELPRSVQFDDPALQTKFAPASVTKNSVWPMPNPNVAATANAKADHVTATAGTEADQFISFGFEWRFKKADQQPAEMPDGLKSVAKNVEKEVFGRHASRWMEPGGPSSISGSGSGSPVQKAVIEIQLPPPAKGENENDPGYFDSFVHMAAPEGYSLRVTKRIVETAAGAGGGSSKPGGGTSATTMPLPLVQIFDVRHRVGVIRALASLAQLIKFDFATELYYLPESIEILRDQPAFLHRGLMLDTGRHYLPKQKIFDVIRLLRVLKMNVLHLHLTEDSSFPLSVFDGGIFDHTANKAQPNNRNASPLNGAYSTSEKYTLADLRHIVAHANENGVRVVPEIDMPGHFASLYKVKPELFACEPDPDTEFTKYVPYPFSNLALDPSREDVYGFLKKLLGVLVGEGGGNGKEGPFFRSEMIHLGGDEVPVDCWKRLVGGEFDVDVQESGGYSGSPSGASSSASDSGFLDDRTIGIANGNGQILGHPAAPRARSDQEASAGVVEVDEKDIKTHIASSFMQQLQQSQSDEAPEQALRPQGRGGAAKNDRPPLPPVHFPQLGQMKHTLGRTGNKRDRISKEQVQGGAKIRSTSQLFDYFTGRMARMVRGLVPVPAEVLSSTSSNVGVTASRRPTFWDEVVNHENTNADLESPVIQVWNFGRSAVPILNRGFDVVLSSSNVWYLDHLDVRHQDVWRGPKELQLGKEWNSQEGVGKVLGGEAPMWSERVDLSNIDMKILPKLALVAERLWANPTLQTTASATSSSSYSQVDGTSSSLTTTQEQGPHGEEGEGPRIDPWIFHNVQPRYQKLRCHLMLDHYFGASLVNQLLEPTSGPSERPRHPAYGRSSGPLGPGSCYQMPAIDEKWVVGYGKNFAASVAEVPAAVWGAGAGDVHVLGGINAIDLAGSSAKTIASGEGEQAEAAAGAGPTAAKGRAGNSGGAVVETVATLSSRSSPVTTATAAPGVATTIGRSSESASPLPSYVWTSLLVLVGLPAAFLAGRRSASSSGARSRFGAKEGQHMTLLQNIVETPRDESDEGVNVGEYNGATRRGGGGGFQ